ncbi:MAG: 30S ribosomal protein S7 [Blastocatellia bacterium]|nr:30S ribosomal protein S7 [Blastocatellia bacterium]
MPRRRVAERREVLPDPVYNSELVTKFINALMWQGKKTVAENIFYDALKELQTKTNDDPLKVFKKALDNVRPRVEVRSRRVGGATYQVPVEVDQRRRGTALAIRWLVTYARNRGEKTMVGRLCGELMEASNSRGNAVKKREETHRMAEANKAFAHYRW